MLKPTILILQRTKALGLGYFEAAVLGLPVLKRSLRYAVSTSKVGRLRACFSLLQYTHNLLFCKP